MLSNPIARLRTAGLIESLSAFTLFFIAMPIKWVPYLMHGEIGNPVPVTVVGSVHGGLFLLYIAVLLLALRSPGLDRKTAGLAVLASLLPFPFGLLVVDPRLKRYEQRPAGEPVAAD